jgi:hypothetical protein
MDLRGIFLVACAANQSEGVATNPDLPKSADAATAISQLVVGLAVGTPQEYDRIPAIWKHAIAAGNRNHTAELQRLLLLSVPEIHEPARHWQVVVIGGGIINGLTMANVWPGRRIQELLHDNSSLVERWERLVTLSAAMADDASVPKGTRYDALRILGTQPFDSSGAQLIRYLKNKSVDLQMGAVSGLGDVEDHRATAALLAEFGSYVPVNRNLAFNALLRTDERTAALLNALESASLSRDLLTQEQVNNLLKHGNEQFRNRAKLILGND